jgi:hypothetical protein
VIVVSARRTARALVVLGAVLGALALGAAAWAAFAPLPMGSRELVYVVPKGSATRLADGAASGLPGRLRLTVGIRDVLVLRNDDDVPTSLGPILLAPGQTYRIPFREPAEFQLSCSAHPDGQIAVVVVPAPSRGWARLAWRVAEALGVGAP